jgi:monoamine oxidase
MKKETILIIGAGISGLILARELSDDYDVIIIEATAKAGGRIASTLLPGFPGIIEGGAEFVHGKLKYTLQLLKEAGINYVEVEGKFYNKTDTGLQEQKEMIPGWDKLLKKMKQVSTDTTLDNFLQEHFSGNEYKELRQHAAVFAEGFDVADTKKVSMQALYDEWSHEEDTNYRIPGGYATLIDYLMELCLQKNCRFIFDQPVKQIDWKKNAITVIAADEKKYTANKTIVTIPLHALQHPGSPAAISFTPSLPGIITAANDIGFGAVIKIICLFKEPLWPADTGFIFSEEIIPTWWTQLPEESALLTGWIGGPKASSLSSESDETIFEKAVTSLSNIFNISPAEINKLILQHKIFNWQKNVFAMGGYSYATTQSGTARKLLNTPVDDTIFFCGEGLYDGKNPGTVEASIASAMQLVKMMK